jgi:hypothetical protein
MLGSVEGEGTCLLSPDGILLAAEARGWHTKTTALPDAFRDWSDLELFRAVMAMAPTPPQGEVTLVPESSHRTGEAFRLTVEKAEEWFRERESAKSGSLFPGCEFVVVVELPAALLFLQHDGWLGGAFP